MLRSEDFRHLREVGEKIHTTHFLVYLNENCYGRSRIGITASRKVGNAVRRNRVKRLVREFYRLYLRNLDRPLDISVIAKRGAPALNLQQVRNELEFISDLSRRNIQWQQKR